MYCPRCEAEYREGFTDCSDCQVPLVTHLPEREAPRPNMKLEKIFETNDPGLLGVAKSLLDDAGIEYMSVGESSGAIFGGIPHFGRVRLQAEASSVEEARALLADLTTGAEEPEGDESG